jgi:prepilin-type N-terminal cleavage/methylation domain-containing protein
MNAYPTRRAGFTLMETVIAIGVLAVLLTAFMAVFGPAAAGIRRALSAQEADRLVSGLEEELSTLRTGEFMSSGETTFSTAFDKAYYWIQDSANSPIMLYQYRGDPNNIRSDGTMKPYAKSGGVAGKDYVVQSGIRRRDDPLFINPAKPNDDQADISAIEGRVFTVKTTQLVFTNGELKASTQTGKLVDPAPTQTPPGTTLPTGTGPAGYPAAVIAYYAEFYLLPTVAESYISNKTKFDVTKLKNPVFVRNLAARR